MTLDISVAPGVVESTQRRQVATYTGPASYATGGDEITPNDVRMGKVFAVHGLSISDGTTVYHGWYNAATGKIMWFAEDGTQVTNGTNLSTFTGRVEFVGQ